MLPDGEDLKTKSKILSDQSDRARTACSDSSHSLFRFVQTQASKVLEDDVVVVIVGVAGVLVASTFDALALLHASLLLLNGS